MNQYFKAYGWLVWWNEERQTWSATHEKRGGQRVLMDPNEILTNIAKHALVERGGNAPRPHRGGGG